MCVGVGDCVTLSSGVFDFCYLNPADSLVCLASLVYIISAVASPVFGYAVDNLGRNVYWVSGCTHFYPFAFASSLCLHIII